MSRFSSVLSGYVTACALGGILGTLAVALAPGYEAFLARAEAEPLRTALSMFVSVLFVGFFLLLSVWPASLALGTTAFLLRTGNWLYYTLGGALAGVVGAWLITLNPDTLLAETAFSQRTALINAGIGAFMGAVYWLIAHPRKTETAEVSQQPAGMAETVDERPTEPLRESDRKTKSDQKAASQDATPKPDAEAEPDSVSTVKPESTAKPKTTSASKSKADPKAKADPKTGKASPHNKSKSKRNQKNTKQPDPAPDMTPPKSFEDAIAEKQGTVKPR